MSIPARPFFAIMLAVLGLGLSACVPVSSTVENPSSGQERSNSSEPTKEPMITATQLPDLGPAPDFTNEVWLNTERPLDLAALRGRAVLVEFWTFG